MAAKRVAGQLVLVHVWEIVKHPLGSGEHPSRGSDELEKKKDMIGIRDVAAELMNALLEKCNENERTFASNLDLLSELYGCFYFLVGGPHSSHS